MSTLASTMTQLAITLESKTPSELFSILKGLMNDVSDAGNVVYDQALDVFESKVSESKFIECCDILNNPA